MAETEALPQSLKLLDHLSTSGSQLRRQLCVAVATISRQIAAEQQRALAQVRDLLTRQSTTGGPSEDFLILTLGRLWPAIVMA